MAKTINLNVLSLEELRNLREQVIDKLRTKSMEQINVGDLYRFSSKRGTIVMRAERINQKSVSGVQIEDGKPTIHRWKVAPSLLSPAS